MQIFLSTAGNELGISGSSSGKLLSNDRGSRCNPIILKVDSRSVELGVDADTIGGRIRKDRIEIGITGKELGRLAGICDRTITKYENGWIDEDKFDPKILMRIAEALRRPSDAYLNEYHKWVVNEAAEDVRGLLDRIRGTGIDKVCKELHTTHASLYSWSRGGGQPTRIVYEYIKTGRG